MSSLNNEKQLDHNRHPPHSTKINISPDSSTLEQLRITDDTRSSKKSEKPINSRIKFGPKKVTSSVSNSVRVRNLKQQLIDGGTVGFELDEFSLLVSAGDNHTITEDIFLDDESVPLHQHKLSDITTMRVISRSMMIQFVNPIGETFWNTFPQSHDD